MWLVVFRSLDLEVGRQDWQRIKKNQVTVRRGVIFAFLAQTTAITSSCTLPNSLEPPRAVCWPTQRSTHKARSTIRSRAKLLHCGELRACNTPSRHISMHTHCH